MLTVSLAPFRKLSLSTVKPLPGVSTSPPSLIAFPPAPAVVAVIVVTARAEVADTPTALPLPAALIEAAILDASTVGFGSITQVPVLVPVLALEAPAVNVSVVKPSADRIVIVEPVAPAATVKRSNALTAVADPSTFVPVTTKSFAQLALVTSKLNFAGNTPAPAVALLPM